MKKLSTFALALALLAAPVAFAGEGASCCKGKDKEKCVKVAGKDCKPEDCKDKDKCTPEERAKCAAAAAEKGKGDTAKPAPKG